MLADGTKIYPDGRVENPSATPKKAHYTEVPTYTEAKELVVATRRKLADLPDVPKTLNAVGAVLSYTLFGLSDDEIALATGSTVERIANIRKTDAYGQMKTQVVQSILATEAETVRDIFAQRSKNAAKLLTDAVDDDSLHPTVRLSAAAQVLDRGGHRPADIVEHRHKMDGGLTIEIIHKDDSKAPVTIDMDI